MAISSFNIIGAGKLGSALANAFAIELNLTCKTLYSRRLEQAEAVSAHCRQGSPTHQLNEILPADITFVTVADDAIAPVAAALAKQYKKYPPSLIIHCSGNLPAAILQPLAQWGCPVASFHPMKSFTSNTDKQPIFRDTFMTYEGDTKAVTAIKPLFKQLGATLIPIAAKDKPLYHASQVMACNYLVTLLDAAFTLAKQVNLPTQALQPLVREKLADIFANGCQAALTGPIARKDKRVISEHIQALAAFPDIQSLYLNLKTLTEKQVKD